MTCETFDTKYIDTLFQVANRIVILSKKSYVSKNLWVNNGEKQKIPS